MRRRATARVAVAAGMAAVLLTGCGDRLDRAAVATAKCNSAAHDELHLDGDSGPITSQVTVTGDDSRRRVEGVWSHRTAGEGTYVCEVVPDEDDDLRGLRVTRLDVERMP